MGNIQSGDLTNPRDANLLLLIVRYWSSLLDAADNLSITSRTKIRRTPSLTSTITQDSKRSRKIRRSRPVQQRRNEIIIEDFDWKTKTPDELNELKGSVQWREFEGWDTVRSPKMKRRFRKKRKKPTDVSKEMWTLSERSYKGSEDDYGTASERIFWRTSASTIPEVEAYAGNNMLWRASKNMEMFSSEMTYMEIEEGNHGKLLKIDEQMEMKTIGNIETMGRKTRLSRWAFLRQTGNGKRPYAPVGKEASFRREPVKRKVSVRKISSVGLVRRTSVRGSKRGVRRHGKGWTIFKGSKEHRIEDEEEVADNCSCYSCEDCQRNGVMAPNSEDSLGTGWRGDLSGKEPLRPPIYNPEDYALSLKKWGKKGGSNLQLPPYVSQSTASLDSMGSTGSKPQRLPLSTKSSVGSNGKGKENSTRNALMLLPPSTGEMTLRQFSTVTELLGKLKTDLQQAFPSFVQEFVGDPVDGVTLLLELLRSVQLSQSSQQQRCPPQILRRALLDEHSCLICLQHCLRCPDASRRLASSPAGLFTLAVCIMSNVTKSRVLALELLTNACEPPAHGHSAVSDALSTLRLRFGEPVRFRFLVGMLNSAGAVELLTAGMRFINAFLETAPSVQQRVYIQSELEQAGFQAETLRKTLPSHSETVKTEICRFERGFVDVAVLQSQVQELNTLREKVQLLEKRIQILQEEKGVLRSLEQCLKERCSELEEEVSTKTSTTLLTARVKPYAADKGESTPAEDEGISSSEQELSQDEDIRPPPEPKKPPRKIPLGDPVKPPRLAYPTGDTKINRGIPANEPDEETTIEEVIEELQNIVNETESQMYLKPEHKSNPPSKGNELQDNLPKKSLALPDDRTRTFTKSDKVEINEAEIIPAKILPQPPRRAKSLVHIFLSGREYEDGSKHEFFDEDTESESSDSLLTREPRRSSRSFRKSFGSTETINAGEFPEGSVRRHRELARSTDNWKPIPQRKPHSFRKEKASYQERNIDEEARKRMNHLPSFSERLVDGFPETKTNKESPFVRRTQRFVPVPVKRSQTFHTQDSKGNDIKPRPKMGVSGLDNKRNDYGKYQNLEYRNKYSKKAKDKVEAQRRGSLDELSFTIELQERCRSKSLERVDDGLDSLVDVVMDANKKRIDVRNIGPRTRRSLAESSLFTPPTPKQRTSLARHNSGSSTPLTLPVEIIPSTDRAPPDGSSSPLNYESPVRKSSKSEESPIYATPVKLSKLHKFFGNPKFENSACEANQKYFESNYACLADRAQPGPRSVVKSLLQPHPQKTAVPNFYLGTYQARPTGGKPPAVPGNPPPSLSSFLIKRGPSNDGLYSGNRESVCSPTPTEASTSSGRQSASSRTTAKLSDSLSGLY